MEDWQVCCIVERKPEEFPPRYVGDTENNEGQPVTNYQAVSGISWGFHVLWLLLALIPHFLPT